MVDIDVRLRLELHQQRWPVKKAPHLGITSHHLASPCHLSTHAIKAALLTLHHELARDRQSASLAIRAQVLIVVFGAVVKGQMFPANGYILRFEGRLNEDALNDRQVVEEGDANMVVATTSSKYGCLQDLFNPPLLVLLSNLTLHSGFCLHE